MEEAEVFAVAAFLPGESLVEGAEEVGGFLEGDGSGLEGLEEIGVDAFVDGGEERGAAVEFGEDGALVVLEGGAVLSKDDAGDGTGAAFGLLEAFELLADSLGILGGA